MTEQLLLHPPHVLITRERLRWQELAMAKELAMQMPGIQVVEQSTATLQDYAKAALSGVQAVPTVFINGKRVFVGAPTSIEALRQASRKPLSGQFRV